MVDAQPRGPEATPAHTPPPRRQSPRPTSGSEPPSPADDDLFVLPPVKALKLLSASVEMLVRITGDVPPTPPPRAPTDPQMMGMQAEKDKIARSHSRSASRGRPAESRAGDAEQSRLHAYSASVSAHVRAQALAHSQEIDGVHLRHPTSSSAPTRCPSTCSTAPSRASSTAKRSRPSRSASTCCGCTASAP